MDDVLSIKRSAVTVDEIKNNITEEKRISLSVLRLDKIHPVVSGNKLFKLHYFLQEAINSSHKKIITFGGAYSNHLAAAAFADNQLNLKTIGIVRGERPVTLSHTLLFCIENKMQLEFISREDYGKKNEGYFLKELKEKYGEHILIPEGGFSEKGMKGAELIANYIKKDYTHICCAVGTATTLAGLIKGCSSQTIIGFNALKDLSDFEQRIKFLLKDEQKNYTLNSDYHFGGYAKKTNELINFMNNFYDQHNIPLDFVYTAKMMFGVFDLIKKNYFEQGSKILCIHTGGLQGNQSLPQGTLSF